MCPDLTTYSLCFTTNPFNLPSFFKFYLPSLLPAVAILTPWNNTHWPTTHRIRDIYTWTPKKGTNNGSSTSVLSNTGGWANLHLSSSMEELVVQSPSANIAPICYLLIPAQQHSALCLRWTHWRWEAVNLRWKDWCLQEMESVVTNLNMSDIYTVLHAVTKEQHSDLPWEYRSQPLNAKLLLMEMTSTGAP